MKPSRQVSTMMILLVLVMVSAFSLVSIRQLNRVAFYDFQKLERHRDELAIEWRQLMAEYSTWRLEHSIETEVRGERNMLPPKNAKIQTIELAQLAQKETKQLLDEVAR